MKTQSKKIGSKFFIAGALISLVSVQACSRQKVADVAYDSTVFVGKTAVKGAVGAGKLAVKGTKAGVNKVRKMNAPAQTGADLPTIPSCQTASGQLFSAPQNPDGTYYCPT